MGEVTADLLKKIGMTVDFVATDWGTVGQRRASKSPPGQGGWGMFHTWHSGGRARAGGRPDWRKRRGSAGPKAPISRRR
jgi:ABC-type transport system substrate-binding protein